MEGVIRADQPRGDVAAGGVRAAPAHRRFAFVDVLRCLAASFVVMQHVVESSSVTSLHFLLELSPGVFGVVLFFVVSGFVIPLSVKKGLKLSDFATRRIFRIYPGLLFAFVLWICVTHIVRPEALDVLTWRDWIANLALVQDFVGAQPIIGVTWTLILEFFWYGLFAASLIVFGARTGRTFEYLFPVMMIILTCASLVSGIRLPLGRIGMIYAAVFGYQTYRHFEGQISTARFRINAAVFLATMFVSCVVAFGYFAHPTIKLHHALIPWMVAPVLFLAATSATVRNSAIMRNPVLAWLGSISFSLYLLHVIAIDVAHAAVGNGLAFILLTLVLTVVFAVVGFYGVERPGITLGRAVAARLEPRPKALLTAAG